jgi:hypothetical protein
VWILWTCVLWYLVYIFLIPQFLRHHTMDKVQKYSSFNTNTPSSESYRNYSFLQVFRPKLFMYFIFPMLSTCPTYLILLEFVTPVIFNEEYKLRSVSLCNFFRTIITTSIISRNILFSTFSQRPSIFVGAFLWQIFKLCPFLNMKVQFSDKYKTAENLRILLTIS